MDALEARGFVNNLSCALIAMNQSPDTEIREIMTRNPAMVNDNASLQEVNL